MKKLVFLFAAVLLTAISANTFAQDGSGTAPSIGSIHQYYVNGTYGTPTTAGEATYYTWWISTTPSDLLQRTALTSDFSVTDGATYDTPTKGDAEGNGIELQWTADADAAQVYYLVVQETDQDGTSCSNLKAIAIQPANNFAVQFVAVNETDTDINDPSRCAPDIAISASGTTISYNYGVDTAYYKVYATGAYTSWSFANIWVNDEDDASVKYEYQIGSGSWTEITTPATSSTISVPANTAGSEVVTVRVAIDNNSSADGAGNFEEGLSGQSFKLTLSTIEDAGGYEADVTDANDAAFSGAYEQTQTVKPRPATSNIGTDN